MNETKELLEATVKGLQEKIQSLQTDLNEKQRQLDNVNKPKITSELYDELASTIEDAVEGLHFDNPDAYEYDFGMEYDGRVYIDSINMQSTHEITNSIMAKIDKTFNVLPKNTEENTVTEVQKVI